MLYDNDRFLVSRILADGARRRARLFGGFLSHYLVRDRYGRPGNPVHLQPNTTYALVLDCMGDCGGRNYVDIGRTDSDAEDASTLAGWTLGDAMMVKDQDSQGLAGSAWSGNFVLGNDGTYRLNPAEPSRSVGGLRRQQRNPDNFGAEYLAFGRAAGLLPVRRAVQVADGLFRHLAWRLYLELDPDGVLDRRHREGGRLAGKLDDLLLGLVDMLAQIPQPLA